LTHELTLDKGDNIIELVAENDGADKQYWDRESTVQRFHIAYEVEAPQIVVSGVSWDTGQMPVNDDKPLVVHRRSVSVQGRITAIADLAEATLDDRPLRHFKPGSAVLDFAEELTLKPGAANEFTFKARTSKSKEATHKLRLIYQP